MILIKDLQILIHKVDYALRLLQINHKIDSLFKASKSRLHPPICQSTSRVVTENENHNVGPKWEPKPNIQSDSLPADKDPQIELPDESKVTNLNQKQLRQVKTILSEGPGKDFYLKHMKSVFVPKNAEIVNTVTGSKTRVSLNDYKQKSEDRTTELQLNSNLKSTERKSFQSLKQLSLKEQKLSAQAKENKVPGSRISRLMSFGGLAAGLGAGTVAEIARRGLGITEKSNSSSTLGSNPLLTSANAERIVNTLCRVRGAALKLGQMLSIQDNSLMDPTLLEIFERVRQSADFMPAWQMKKVLVSELGSDWREKLEDFDEKPFAAASIGQVHRATLPGGRKIAMKIQYPGVAQSIESDINNLSSILRVWNILPEGLYAENMIKVARRELSWEVDYKREAECSKRFKKLLENRSEFHVPEVIDEFSTKQLLSTEFVDGVTLDNLLTQDQKIKNSVARRILVLCLDELFVFNFMQTDPNWSNFLYNPKTDQINLLDFGASREFSKKFTDDYIKVIHGASIGDREKVKEYSIKLGFLSGYESQVMEKAHIDTVMLLGEAFASPSPFDFGSQSTASRVHQLIPIMLRHRLTPPPEESYSLHRKMAGCFLLCTKLQARIECQSIFREVLNNYQFSNDENSI